MSARKTKKIQEVKEALAKQDTEQLQNLALDEDIDVAKEAEKAFDVIDHVETSGPELGRESVDEEAPRRFVSKDWRRIEDHELKDLQARGLLMAHDPIKKMGIIRRG
jgi:hypothetical protein